MKKIILFTFALVATLAANAERHAELLPYADFENWAVRYIKESGIIGGGTTTLYAIAPTDTIYENKPFIYGKKGNIWSVSNAYAKVSGIEKGSGTLRPEYRDSKNGYCCRMDSKFEEVVAMGFIDITIQVSGTLFTGRNIEPIRTQKDPYQNIDFGVPFTRHPVAIQFDYKTHVRQDDFIWHAKGMSKPKKIPGKPAAQLTLVLQKRWEDEKGNIYALRVGSAYERYCKDVPEWINAHEVPIHYGDITGEPFYKEWMGLCLPMRAMNSKGKIVPVREIGWAPEGTDPTHMIINITSDHHDAFTGPDGSTFWVDNIKLVYE